MYPITFDTTKTQLHINTFIRSVYNWMAIGLAITGLMAYYVAHSEVLLGIVFGNRLVFFGLIIGELTLVFSLARRIGRMRASTATGLFLLYSALNGITLSAVLLIYTRESLSATFFIAAVTFLACSIFGMSTKRDLTSLGGFMTMGLIGILIASVVNLFIGSSGIRMIISYIGVIVFVGLTAYDTQKLKAMAMSQPAGLDGGIVRKGAVVGALTLYLDFINLFLMLLYILGGSRE
ncbi:MAG: Bax inhibitor-1/YccA family protein [Desulfobacterales bacterium]